MSYLKNPLVLLMVYVSACYVLTFLTRRIVEAWKPGLRKQADANAVEVSYLSNASRWWNEVILYTIAPAYGVVLALAMRTTDYFPSDFDGGYLVAIIVGLVCGFTCSWFFKVLKKVVSRAAKVEEEELDELPTTPRLPGG